SAVDGADEGGGAGVVDRQARPEAFLGGGVQRRVARRGADDGERDAEDPCGQRDPVALEGKTQQRAQPGRVASLATGAGLLAGDGAHRASPPATSASSSPGESASSSTGT